jgi:uncharacterized membrane protein
MQPLASTAREARVIAQAQLGVAFLFAIAAALLNPLEMAIGIVLATPSVFALAYFGLLRRSARGVIASAAPATTDEREEHGAVSRRIAWPVAGEVAVLLLLAGVGHAPGLMAGVAFGLGLALWQTSRQIERWEVAHNTLLLREPGTRRYYLARGDVA